MLHGESGQVVQYDNLGDLDEYNVYSGSCAEYRSPCAQQAIPLVHAPCEYPVDEEQQHC